MTKVIPTIMKSKEWKRLMAKKHRFRVIPFKQTKEEKERAKLLEKLIEYQLGDVLKQIWKDLF